MIMQVNIDWLAILNAVIPDKFALFSLDDNKFGLVDEDSQDGDLHSIIVPQRTLHCHKGKVINFELQEASIRQCNC